MTFDDELERQRREFDEAIDLIDDGQFERVYRKTISDLDTLDRDNRWYTMRIFEKLVTRYPGAVSALRERRDRLEIMILEQRSDRKIYHDWNDLNDVLQENLRTMDVYNQLVARKASKETLDRLLFFIYRRLIEEGRYSEVEIYLESMTSFLFSRIGDYDACKLFPRKVFESEEEALEDQAITRRYVAKEGPLVFEAALGLGRTDVAEAILKKMTRLEPSDRIYAKLIRGAAKAKSYSLALELHKRAQLVLEPGKMKKTNKALRYIPDEKLPQA